MSATEWVRDPIRNRAVSRLHRVVAVWVRLAFAFSIGSSVLAQPGPESCGSLDNGQNGPFDYLVERGRKLSVVEEFHFTPTVESLIRGQSATVAGDLAYTLTVFPNHHRALMAMQRLGEKLKSPQPPGALYTVECYFERALRFRRNDVIARMIYAAYLAKNARATEAVQQLEVAAAAAGDNPFTHNNIGLIYFDMKEYDKALQEAHKAIALGYEQLALREQLQKAGKWSEPPDKAVASPVPTATPSAGSTSEASSGAAQSPAPKTEAN